jgi:meso-butanediol dehydrogenase/(S,S)-butanediol dehydrogenase/diacetyl reductase
VTSGIAGRRALVTGGASGIGFGVAQRLVELDAKVAMADVNADALRAAAEKVSAVPIQMDVRDGSSVRDGVAAAVNELGGLDTLVNCAGVFTFRDFEEITEDEWDFILDVNLRGTFLCCQAAIGHIKQSGRGRIVNIASDAGKRAEPFLAHYSASKFGVVGLTQSLAQEFGKDKVTANAVCPVSTPDTGMGRLVLEQKIQRRGQSADKILADGAASFPLGRLGTVEDVVATVCFLISDGASFISGESINIDGGVVTG